MMSLVDLVTQILAREIGFFRAKCSIKRGFQTNQLASVLKDLQTRRRARSRSRTYGVSYQSAQSWS